MRPSRSQFRIRLLGAPCLAVPALAVGACLSTPAVADDYGALFMTSSHYTGQASTVVVGQPLPNSTGVAAIANGTYPYVFSNDTVDGNFGITAPIDLSAFLTRGSVGSGIGVGALLGTIDLTAVSGVATSFSSKSELALNVSTDGAALTLMGYLSPINVLDVSNSNTPGFVDPTNTDVQTSTYRAVLELGTRHGLRVLPVAAYSGNNGRAAILASDLQASGQDAYLLVGNGGNGSGTPPTAIVADTGVQLATPGSSNPTTGVVGTPQGTPGAKTGYQFGFTVASLGDAPDKSGKDDNFRGETVFDNLLYVSKGSGGNGVNTVYQVAPGADPLQPGQAQITILPGFPTGLAANITPTSTATEFYPFGIWFANATTLYVADEGVQSLGRDPNAGLQKWIFNGSRWVLAYTLQNGLNLDRSYTVAKYPSALAPATTGLRNITGKVEGGTVTIFAATATFSAAGDPGADPNQVVQIVDQLGATSLPAAESFATVAAPAYGKVYRGVAYVQCGTPAACLATARLAQR